MRIEAASQEFLDDCRWTRNHSPHTLRAYGIDLADFKGHLQQTGNGDPPVAELNEASIRGFLGSLFERRLRESSIRRRMACLRSFITWLERRNLIEESPFRRLDVRISVPRSLPRALTMPEFRRLVAIPNQDLDLDSTNASLADRLQEPLSAREFDALTILVAIEMLFFTGMRVSELTALELNNLDLETGRVRVLGKGSRERTVFLVDPQLTELISTYKSIRENRANGYPNFLVTPRAKPATPPYLRRRFRKAGERASLSRRITPHMLRHTCATQLLESGVDIRYVQALLGHRSIATTEIYTQVTSKGLRAAMESAGLRKQIEGGD